MSPFMCSVFHIFDFRDTQPHYTVDVIDIIFKRLFLLMISMLIMSPLDDIFAIYIPFLEFEWVNRFYTIYIVLITIQPYFWIDVNGEGWMNDKNSLNEYRFSEYRIRNVLETWSSCVCQNKCFVGTKEEKKRMRDRVKDRKSCLRRQMSAVNIQQFEKIEDNFTLDKNVETCNWWMASLRIVGLPHRLFPNKILSFASDAFLTFHKNCAIILNR